MALLEEQFTETLDAGAPDITYQGNEGKEQQIARQLWDQLPNEIRMQFGSFQQFFSSGAWKEVLARLQQAQQQVPERIQETETIQTQPQQGLGSMMPAQMARGGVPEEVISLMEGIRTPRGEEVIDDTMTLASAPSLEDSRNEMAWNLFGKPLHELTEDQLQMMDEYNQSLMAYGGVAGADGRKAYGIGSWFQKKIMDPIKKNPLVTAAVLGLGANYIGGPTNNWMGRLWDKIPTGSLTNIKEGIGSVLRSPEWMIPAASLVAGAFAKPEQQLEGGAMSRGAGINLQDIAKLANITDEKQGQAIGLNFLPEASARKYSPEEMALTYSQAGKAQGGRIGAQEGGLMSLGGMEMDLRGGGFVPIGEREKADDVPARLSKNEFVFTADAVRAAGGGDVDAGADKMYRTMKDLEGMVA